MKQTSSLIVKDLRAAGAIFAGATTQAEKARLDDMAIVKADLAPLAAKATAAADALEAIFSEHDSLVLPFHRPPENNWQHMGRMAMDYSRLQAEIDRYHSAKQRLQNLRSVPAMIDQIALQPPSQRPGAIQELSRTIDAWVEAPQVLIERTLPSIAFYAAKVAAREKNRDYAK